MQLNDFVRKAYYAYFDMSLGDKSKSWAPRIVCKTCGWNHVDDRYLCITPAYDFTKKPDIKSNIPTSVQSFYQFHIHLKFLHQYL